MIATLAEAAVTMSQSIELSIVGKATAIIVAGLAAARLASHARASVRHLLLAATFASLIALPLLLVAAPQATIDVPVAYPNAAAVEALAVRPAGVVDQSAPENRPIVERRLLPVSGVAIARAVWLAGMALFMAPVTIVLWRLHRIRRAGLPWSEFRGQAQALAFAAGVRRPVEVMRHEQVPGPITFGLTRPVIVMPADAGEWLEADVRRAVVHEVEHIQRCDWLLLLVARSICACYWFHPLAWVAWRQLSLEAERSCDDAVVLNEERTDYAEQLVALAARLSAAQEVPMLGMANRSDLSTRVSAVLDDRQRRGRAGLGLVAGAMGAAGLMVLTVAPVRAVANAETAAKAETGFAVVAMEQRGERPSRPSGARRLRALDNALFEAAKDGDLEGVNDLIAVGANVNATIEGDGSPLIGAAQSGVIAVVKRLLDAGAGVNMPVEGDGSPLIHAAARGYLNVVSLLLERGADVNQIVPGDENALMCASEQGQLPVVQLLVKHGANVNERIWTEWAGRDGEWRTAVSQARKNGHTAVVSFLLSAGARE